MLCAEGKSQPMLSLPREGAATGVLGYRAGRRERNCPGCCAHNTQGKAFGGLSTGTPPGHADCRRGSVAPECAVGNSPGAVNQTHPVGRVFPGQRKAPATTVVGASGAFP
jgi:hypothetical protein